MMAGAAVLKVISVILYLAATIAFFTLSIRNVMDYMTQSYVLSSKYEAVNSLKLPNVSICPISWVDSSKLKEDYSASLIEYLGQTFLDPNMPEVAFRYNLTTSYLEMKLTELAAANPSFSARSHLEEVQTSCEDEIARCRVNGDTHTSKECCEYRIDTLTNVGPCFSFYTPGVRQITPGPAGGATITMMPQKRNYDIIKNSVPVRGYVMFIDDAPALIRTSSIFLGADMSTNIQLSMTRNVLQHDCIEEKDYPDYTYLTNNNEGFKRKATCVYDCVVGYILDTCGCIPFTEQIQSQYEPLFCSTNTTVHCVRPWVTTRGAVTTKLCETSCKQNCEYTTFDRQVEIAEIDYEYMATANLREKSWESKTDLLHVGVNVSESSIAIFQIFYTDIGYTKNSEELQISIYTLISNIGGQMGMWLGMSLLSMNDALQYFFNRRNVAIGVENVRAT